MSILDTDEKWMRRALELARLGWGTTSPNPMVGALVVEDGVVVAEGFHAKDGGPHAERVALSALGRKPKAGACLYVTLEPCSTCGRTGACTDLIRESGLQRVVVGATDPNPSHAAEGLNLLRRAGVDVVSGVLGAECEDLNILFNHWMSRATPLLAGKVAVTLDGKMATRLGDSQWITGEPARADVHRWRRLFPGIAVGAGTIVADNPRLTARVNGIEWCPRRFVFDGRLSLWNDRHLPVVFTDAFREQTTVVTTQHAGLGYVRKLRDLGVGVWVIESPSQKVTMADFRKRCAEEKLIGVYFEGGPRLLSELIQRKELDYLFAYRAPVLLADEKARSVFSGLRTEKLLQAVRLKNVQHATFGEDALMRGSIVYPEKLHVDETVFGVGE